MRAHQLYEGKVTNSVIKAHLDDFIANNPTLSALSLKPEKDHRGPILVANVPVQEAAAVYQGLKASGFKTVPGEGGLLENREANILIFIDSMNEKGKYVRSTKVADFKAKDIASIRFNIGVANAEKIGQAPDPAITVLKGLTDLGGVVKPYENKKQIGAVVEWPPSFAGTKNPYGGVSDEHKKARLAVIQQIETLAGVPAGTYQSMYKDSFDLAGFYAANPGTPKWVVVRAK
jgi:hypothetical protein